MNETAAVEVGLIIFFIIATLVQAASKSQILGDR